MAKATREMRPVETVKPVIVLELTEEEALTLFDIVNKIGGSPTDSRRGTTDNIADALISAGVRRGSWPTDISGTIHFHDNIRTIDG